VGTMAAVSVFGVLDVEALLTLLASDLPLESAALGARSTTFVLRRCDTCLIPDHVAPAAVIHDDARIKARRKRR